MINLTLFNIGVKNRNGNYIKESVEINEIQYRNKMFKVQSSEEDFNIGLFSLTVLCLTYVKNTSISECN